MKNRLRTFIAVSLSSSVLTGIEKIVRKLRSESEGINWVEANNLHVTLKFLGDVHLNNLPQLIQAVTHSVSRSPSFDLTFQGFGVFPNRETPKAIWIGCNEGALELAQLAGNINEGLMPMGFPKETRKFSPHLTIGRIKKVEQDSSPLAFLDEHQTHLFGSCSVSEVQIFSSELTRKGPIYGEIAAIPLRF